MWKVFFLFPCTTDQAGLRIAQAFELTESCLKKKTKKTRSPFFLNSILCKHSSPVFFIHARAAHTFSFYPLHFYVCRLCTVHHDVLGFSMVPSFTAFVDWIVWTSSNCLLTMLSIASNISFCAILRFFLNYLNIVFNKRIYVCICNCTSGAAHVCYSQKRFQNLGDL